jgi:hypothetical protein
VSCPDCGTPIVRQCAGHISSGPRAGHRCHHSANQGMTVCGSHGGRAPQVKAAAKRRVTEEQIEAAAAKWAPHVKVSAADALTAELARTNGLVLWLEAKCAELDDPVWGTESRTLRTNPGGGADRTQPQVEVTQSARVHVYVAWLERERDRLHRIAADMERLGLEHRVVRVTEAQGLQLARVVRGILDDLHLTPEQKARIPEIVPRRIRELAA